MAKRKAKPVTLPPFTWETDGGTGTTDATGAPIRAPLARPAVSLGAIEEKTLSASCGTVKTARRSVWRVATPAAVAALPETDREALAYFAFCVAHVGASSGAIDPSGGGGSAATPTGPSLSRIAAAQSIRRVNAALDGCVLQLRPCGPAVSYHHLVEALAIEEQTPAAIARKLDGTATARPSRPALAAVKAAIPDASARVAFALGYRSDVGFD